MANVHIGNREYANVRRLIDTLPAGAYAVRVESEGFQTREIPLNLRAGATETIRVELQRNP